MRLGAPVLFGGAPATFHMKIASSPMSAIEALQLDAAYVAVAKSLELPCQSYMALSDGPILDAQAGLRRRAEAGKLAFGTVDSFLIWRLTSGAIHATDVSNASRTLLYSLRARDWDPELLRLFGVPTAILARVIPSSGVVAEIDSGQVFFSRGCLRALRSGWRT